MAAGFPLLAIAAIMCTVLYLVITYKNDLDVRLDAVEAVMKTAVHQEDLKTALNFVPSAAPVVGNKAAAGGDTAFQFSSRRV